MCARSRVWSEVATTMFDYSTNLCPIVVRAVWSCEWMLNAMPCSVRRENNRSANTLERRGDKRNDYAWNATHTRTRTACSYSKRLCTPLINSFHFNGFSATIKLFNLVDKYHDSFDAYLAFTGMRWTLECTLRRQWCTQIVTHRPNGWLGRTTACCYPSKILR